MGISSGTSNVRAAFDYLGTSINTSLTNIVSSVGTQLNTTMQSVMDGVRYGAGLVNLATADVLAQSLAAEQQVRAKWEALKAETAKPLPTPPITGGLNPWDPDYVPPPNTPPVVPPPPPPPPFDTLAFAQAVFDVTGDPI